MLTKAVLAILVLTCAVALPPSGNANIAIPQTKQKQAPKSRRYSCPMHPEVVSNRRGKCPKCGMRLRLVEEGATPAAIPSGAPAANGATFSSKRIPDIQIYDQTGRRSNFYSDLIKGKTVAINFIFTTCTGICPPLTATFRRVQQDLIESNLPVQLISISVDPVTDTPARLKEYATKFNAAPGWTFVTGDAAAINSILESLGTAVADKADHTSMILIGNDLTDSWTRAYGLSSPVALVKIISAKAKAE